MLNGFLLTTVLSLPINTSVGLQLKFDTWHFESKYWTFLRYYYIHHFALFHHYLLLFLKVSSVSYFHVHFRLYFVSIEAMVRQDMSPCCSQNISPTKKRVTKVVTGLPRVKYGIYHPLVKPGTMISSNFRQPLILTRRLYLKFQW